MDNHRYRRPRISAVLAEQLEAEHPNEDAESGCPCRVCGMGRPCEFFATTCGHPTAVHQRQQKEAAHD